MMIESDNFFHQPERIDIWIDHTFPQVKYRYSR